MAHNPEVEGSNPSPATKARGPFSNREGAFCMRFVHDRAPSDAARLADSHGQRALTSPRSRTVLNATGFPFPTYRVVRRQRYRVTGGGVQVPSRIGCSGQ